MWVMPGTSFAAAFARLDILNAKPAPNIASVGPSTPPALRETIRLVEPGQPSLALQVQRPQSQLVPPAIGDAIYVHGATFGADLSIFYEFDGRSWADALNGIGLTVWGFDFAGYGGSDRYESGGAEPAGSIDDVIPQLHRVVAAVRTRNGNRPVALVAHSWGGAVAARYAELFPQDVKALALFAPVVTRTPAVPPAVVIAQSHYPLTQWAQYRRFVEDVPRGQPQVLSEAHFQGWGAAFLATDPSAADRVPPSVVTPYGPAADIAAAWSGRALYDPSLVAAPALLVRGEWDSVCADADASRLLQGLGSDDKADVRIERATHLMHLESQRVALYDRVNAFLQRTMQ
jgi:pimeloyl-ACP methyl ester carboxylesterase